MRCPIANKKTNTTIFLSKCSPEKNIVCSHWSGFQTIAVTARLALLKPIYELGDPSKPANCGIGRPQKTCRLWNWETPKNLPTLDSWKPGFQSWQGFWDFQNQKFASKAPKMWSASREHLEIFWQPTDQIFGAFEANFWIKKFQQTHQHQNPACSQAFSSRGGRFFGIFKFGNLPEKWHKEWSTGCQKFFVCSRQMTTL